MRKFKKIFRNTFFQKKNAFMISGFGVLFNKKIFAPQIMMMLFAFLLVFSFCFNFLFRLSFFSQIGWVYSVRCGDQDIFPLLINGLQLIGKIFLSQMGCNGAFVVGLVTVCRGPHCAVCLLRWSVCLPSPPPPLIDARVVCSPGLLLMSTSLA